MIQCCPRFPFRACLTSICTYRLACIYLTPLCLLLFNLYPWPESSVWFFENVPIQVLFRCRRLAYREWLPLLCSEMYIKPSTVAACIDLFYLTLRYIIMDALRTLRKWTEKSESLSEYCTETLSQPKLYQPIKKAYQQLPEQLGTIDL